MNNYRILIVEDEILIADTMERYLVRKGHQVVGKAISYEESIQLYQLHQPDLVLLDIRLNGLKSGINVAHFIQNQNNPSPFIFLTSQIDARSISNAKETFPAGYLTKPIQKESLFTTIEIAMYSHQKSRVEEPSINLYDGNKNYLVLLKDILFLQADHIYVKVHVAMKKCIVLRSSLKELLTQLPDNQFIQTHRSFAINIEKVNNWDNQNVSIQNEIIPVSRTRRKEVFHNLNANLT